MKESTVYECKLNFFKKTKSTDEDVKFSQKDIALVKSGCLLEIYGQITEKHFLVKVESVSSSGQQKDSLMIDQSFASSMGLPSLKMIKLRIIQCEQITLDVLDLIIKDQYFCRSDMYRFSENIRSLALFDGRKLEYNSFRATVGDLWCKGKRITFGYVGKDTRVVYRSKSGVVHIFIQMSREMWEFDNFGDNYFEKAIHFISDLFYKYNEQNCGHDVTIVLFSRVFIYPNSADNNTSKLKVDHKNRFYEDFFCVVVQNERYMISEWRKVIKSLRLQFNHYKSELEQFIYNKCQSNELSIQLSQAEDSNFLQTLNMTLNLYENYYIDRNFDRTGKICVVITAGSGVFNVDRNHTQLTKQRICDLGVGIDLVCIGEQPLHAVPLFIFHSKEETQCEAFNDYCIPYWINHSFYRSQNELQAIKMGQFIPRIKIKIEEVGNPNYKHAKLNPDSFQNESEARSVISVPATNENQTLISSTNSLYKQTEQPAEMCSSKDDSCIKSYKANNRKITFEKDCATKRKSLINPFVSNRLNIRATTNSRRWSHVFPIDEGNNPIQMHHRLDIDYPSLSSFQNRKPKNMAQAWQKYYNKFREDNPNSNIFLLQSSPSSESSKDTNKSIISPNGLFGSPDQSPAANEADTHSVVTSHSSMISPLPASFPKYRKYVQTSSHKGSVLSGKKTLSYSDEQRWNWESPKPEDSPINHLETNKVFSMIGVDWKSLTIPALLPLTSDYYPDDLTLENQFMENNYQLMSQNLFSFESTENVYSTVNQRKTLSIDEVFKELINSRLNQGFQLVVNPPQFNQQSSSSTPIESSKKATGKAPIKKKLRLCIGRMYHCLEKQQDMISVTQLIQKYLDNTMKIDYNYCMKMPDSIDYMKFRTQFSLQNNFLWNYYDNYILTYGSNIDTDSSNEFKLQACDRFWRSRFLLVPTDTATRSIMEDNNESPRCDIYKEKGFIDHKIRVEEFFLFMEIINKFRRRVQNSKKGIQSACVLSQQNEHNRPHRHSVVTDNPSRYQTIKLFNQQHPPHSQHQSNIYSKLIGSNLASNQNADTINSNTASTASGLTTVLSNHSLNNTSSNSNPPTPNEKLPKQFTFDGADNNIQGVISDTKERLTQDTSVDKIMKAMEDKETGLNFLPSVEPGKYPLVFTSYECVHWVMTNIDEITTVCQAVTFLQKLMSAKDFICLTNTAFNQFNYGFYLYMMNPRHDKRLVGSASLENLVLDLSVGSTSSTIISSNTPTVVAAMTNENRCRTQKGIFELTEVLLGIIEINGKSEEQFVNDIKKNQAKNRTINSEMNLLSGDLQRMEFLMTSLPDRAIKNVVNKSNFYEMTGKIPAEDNMVYENGVIYKKVVLDVENNDDTRTEWGVFQHQSVYHPSMAFEFTFQWLVATGIKLLDKINHWSRKLTHFQIIPVPCDPFALPSSFNSDPLRGPIFVPLKVNCLLEPDQTDATDVDEIINNLFQNFHPLERSYRLLLMQESILKRFGFVPDNCIEYSTVDLDKLRSSDNNSNNNIINDNNSSSRQHGLRRHQWTYVHCSGGMFAMLPKFCNHEECEPRNSRLQTSGKSSASSSANTMPSPKSDQGPPDWRDDEPWIAPEIGFLWSWNKMLPKKLQSSTSLADEAFQDNMLADFRKFCMNDNNRLVDYYNETVKHLKEIEHSLANVTSSQLTKEATVMFQISTNEEDVEDEQHCNYKELSDISNTEFTASSGITLGH